MRRIFLSFIAIPLLALAQQRPADLEPLPVPPPPPGMDNAAEQPQVTIVRRGQDQVEEYRIKGRLYMMKVTPRHGKSYYLVDQQGAGWIRHDGDGHSLSVPQWVIGTF